MKKRYIICFIVTTMLACIFMIPVFADASYYVVPADTCITSTFNNGSDRYLNILIKENVSEVRGVILKDSSNRLYLYLLSESQFYYAPKSMGSSQACAGSYNRASVGNSGYASYASGSIASSYHLVSSVFPLHEIDNSKSEFDWAIYYTFGDGSETEPTPEPINWGILKNVSFEQRTRGTGYINYKNNLDYISWDPLLDANNNDISECQVQIRAKTGLWSATEPDELNRLDMHNFVEDEVVDLGTYNASIGTMSFSCQGVLEGIHGYDSPFMVPIEEQLMNEVWKKVGWYYEVRLIPPDSEPLTWQQVYTPLYSSVKDSQTILNNTYITNDVINTYQNITQLNNQTQMIVNYNNTETTIVNPEQEPQYDTNSDLYSDILRKILNSILSIPLNIQNATENITQSISEIPQGIASLFTFNAAEELPTDQEMTELITEKVENTYIGDLVLALGRIKTAFARYKGTYSTIGQVTIPTLGFMYDNQYHLIYQGTTFNLYDVVRDPSGGIHVFYQTYLSIVDGIIYITLLRMLYKRLIHSLENE